MEITDADAGDATTIQLKQCPRCRVPIRRNLRYGTIINQVLADIEQVLAHCTQFSVFCNFRCLGNIYSPPPTGGVQIVVIVFLDIY